MYAALPNQLRTPWHTDPYSKWQVPAVCEVFPRIVQHRWDTSRWKYGGRKVVEGGLASQWSHWCIWNSTGTRVCPFSVGKGRKKEEEEESTQVQASGYTSLWVVHIKWRQIQQCRRRQNSYAQFQTRGLHCRREKMEGGAPKAPDPIDKYLHSKRQPPPVMKEKRKREGERDLL